MVPLLHIRASALSFVWPTTVSRHFGLLAFVCMAVFGVEWSIIRRDDNILSHSTSFEASNSAFLAVASWSGIFQHGSFTRVYCPVALEFFHCSAFLCLRFLCVFTQLLGLSCAGFYVRELWCFLRISNFVSSPLFGWIPRFGLLFPSLCVLIGFCGGSLFCSALYTPQTFAWFLVLAANCFMVLLLPRAGLHAMLSEVQVSTQHVTSDRSDRQWASSMRSALLCFVEFCLIFALDLSPCVLFFGTSFCFWMLRDHYFILCWVACIPDFRRCILLFGTPFSSLLLRDRIFP